MNYRQIVWLASYPKSGNTWVRCFMDAYYVGEVDLNELICSIPDDSLHTHEPWPDSNAVNLPIDIQQLCRPMAMLRSVHVWSQMNTGVPLYVKTHNAHMISNGIELLPMALTKATIYIVRNPIDVLPSYAKHMGMEIDEAIDAMNHKYRCLSGKDTRMADFISSWDDNVKSYIQADTHNVQVFRYEDMLKDPVFWFGKILEHAGETPDMERVEKAVELVKLDRLRKKEAKDGFKEASPKADQFFGKGGSRSRDKLTTKQMNTIEKYFSHTMKKLGYIDKVRRIA